MEKKSTSNHFAFASRVWPNAKKALAWALPFVSLWVLYKRLDVISLVSLTNELKEVPSSLLFFGLGTLVFLSFANWLLDTYAWMLFLPASSFPFLKLLRFNIISLSFGFFTPFQLGEYIGKRQLSATLKSRHSYYSTLAYRTTKLFAKIILGLIVIGVIISKNNPVISLGCLSLASALIVIYLAQDSFWRWKCLKDILIRLKLKNVEKSKAFYFRGFALIASSLKIITYCVQFYICVWLVSPFVAFLPMLSATLLFYTISAWVPSIGFLDPMIKSSLGLLVFSSSLVSSGAIIYATAVVWLINVGIPAFFGAFLYLKPRK